jgi:hypothetical protein
MFAFCSRARRRRRTRVDPAQPAARRAHARPCRTGADRGTSSILVHPGDGGEVTRGAVPIPRSVGASGVHGRADATGGRRRRARDGSPKVSRRIVRAAARGRAAGAGADRRNGEAARRTRGHAGADRRATIRDLVATDRSRRAVRILRAGLGRSRIRDGARPNDVAAGARRRHLTGDGRRASADAERSGGRRTAVGRSAHNPRIARRARRHRPVADAWADLRAQVVRHDGAFWSLLCEVVLREAVARGRSANEARVHPRIHDWARLNHVAAGAGRCLLAHDGG